MGIREAEEKEGLSLQKIRRGLYSGRYARGEIRPLPQDLSHHHCMLLCRTRYCERII